MSRQIVLWKGFIILFSSTPSISHHSLHLLPLSPSLTPSHCHFCVRRSPGIPIEDLLRTVARQLPPLINAGASRDVSVRAHACVSLSWQLSLIDSCRPSGLHCNPSAPRCNRRAGLCRPPRRRIEEGGWGAALLRPCPTVGQHATGPV